MRSKRTAVMYVALCLLFPGTPWAQGALEIPQPASIQSGIGIASGWNCNANRIDIEFNGGTPFQAAYGTDRQDTASVCGDANNGFGLLFNWNLLGNGTHSVRALADGTEFASASFTVTTLGQEFLTGASGNYALEEFPNLGQGVTVQWEQSQQNFVIAALANTQPVEIKQNTVPNLTTADAFTVPSGQRLVITDVVISNDNPGGACCQRIFRGNPSSSSRSEATGFIGVPAGDSFEHTFSSGIDFTAGEVVRVRNGDSAGPTHFTLRGFLTSP